MKNPTGEEYFVNAFLFEKNKSLSKKALAEKSGLGLDCINFDSNVESSKVIANENIIDFESDFTADVGIKCESNNGCDIFCTLTIYYKGSR
jgi:hypothetical protein